MTPFAYLKMFELVVSAAIRQIICGKDFTVYLQQLIIVSHALPHRVEATQPYDIFTRSLLWIVRLAHGSLLG